jgi:hypothetical protein
VVKNAFGDYNEISKDYSMESILEQQKTVIRQKGLTILSGFDTFEKTSGKKDVSLCKTKKGEKIILRVGEARPQEFFSNGFNGKYLRIPKILERHLNNIPFELEEYFEGPHIGELDRVSQRQGRISDELLDKLIAAFWEFQQIGQKVFLDKKFKKEKLLNYFNKAKKLIKNPDVVYKVIIGNENFWDGEYPSKWKYSLDNFIMTSDQKIGFIDNAGVGLRYFGYDLGWLIWPQWFYMETDQYSAVDEHVGYLENFITKVIKIAPNDFTKQQNLEHYCWLVIFERLVGALFDVVNQTIHLSHWGMGPGDSPARRERHVRLLNKLLKVVTEKLRQG